MIDYNNLPDVAPEISLEELFEAGVHYGHQSKKWHPKMAEWIYTEQEGVHIFDLEKTAAQLRKAYNFAYDLGKNKKNLVVVGTKKQVSDMAEAAAEEAGAMYIVHRWMGGLLTNWDQVSKSIKRMNEIEKGLSESNGKFKDLTKYERTMLAKELERLKRFFGGLKDLRGLPDAVLVIDVLKEKNAVKEVLIEKVPMMAIIDSNSNPEGIDIPVPANDDALSSVELVLKTILAGYKAGKEGKKLEVVEGAKEKSVEEDKEEKKVVEEVAEKTEKVEEEAEKSEKKTVGKAEVKKATAKKTVEKKTDEKKVVEKKTATKKTLTKKKAE